MATNAIRPYQFDESGKLTVLDLQAADAPEAEGRGFESAQRRAALGRMSHLIPNTTAAQRSSDLLGAEIHRDVGVGLRDYWTYHSLPRHSQDEWLVKRFGAGNVAKDVEGSPLVRQTDTETGEEKWTTMTDEGGGTAYSLSRIATMGPEAVGGVLGWMLTPTGKLGSAAKFLTKMAGSSVAAQGLGAVQDASVQAGALGEVDAAHIAKQRAINVPIDIGAGLGLAGVFKVFGRAVTPLQKRGPVEFDYKEAINIIDARRAQYGLYGKWPATVGELTGNTDLQMVEQFAAMMPGGKTVFTRVAAEQNRHVVEFQKIVLGVDPRATTISVPPVEQVGREVMDVVQSSAQPFKDAVNHARRNTAEALEATARLDVSDTTGLVSPVHNIATVGKMIRDSVFSARESWKGRATQQYDEIFNQPWAVDDTLVPVSGLAARLSPIQRQLQTIRTAEGERVMLRDWTPSGVQSRIQGIVDNAEGTTSIDALRRMRTDLDEDLFFGQALPNQGQRYLKQIRQALTDELESSVERLGGADALARYQQINSEYAANAARFERKGIAELFRDPGQGNYIADRVVAERVIGDSDLYKTYRQFFGENSDQMRILRRSVADRTLQLSESSSYGDVIDAGKFSKALRQLWDDNQDLAVEVFGENSKYLARLAEAVSSVSSNPRVNLFAFKDLVDEGGLTMKSIQSLLQKQALLDEQFSNSLRKSIADGVAPSAKPHQIVDSLLNDRTLGLKDVDEIMTLVREQNPELASRVQTLARMDIYLKSSKASRAADNPAKLRGDLPELEVVGLRERLGLHGAGSAGDVATSADRVRSVIGAEAYDDMLELTKALTPRQAKAELSPLGGALKRGEESSKMTHGGIADRIAYQMNKAKAWTLAMAYNTPALNRYLANNFLDPVRRAMVMNTVIASTPFIVATIDQWGPEVAKEWITMIKEESDSILMGIETMGDKLPTHSGYTDGQTIPAERFIKPPPTF